MSQNIYPYNRLYILAKCSIVKYNPHNPPDRNTNSVDQNPFANIAPNITIIKYINEIILFIYYPSLQNAASNPSDSFCSCQALRLLSDTSPISSCSIVVVSK